MKQWEYKRVYFEDIEKEVREAEGPGIDGFSQVLNRLGRNGWELCQAIPLDDDFESYQYIFKREKKYLKPIDKNK